MSSLSSHNIFSRRTAILAATVALFSGCSQPVVYRDVSLEVPFALYPGEGASVESRVYVVLDEVSANGKCPGWHQECVAVPPPDATLIASIGGTSSARMVYMLLGKSTQCFENWDIEVMSSEPAHFTDADVAAHRVSVVLRVTRHSEQVAI
jgi:hypothetical protein